MWVQRSLCVRGHRVGAANAVCYVCHWRGMGRPKPTQAATRKPLGPNQVLVGHQACLGHGGGHTTWTCRECDPKVYGPPLNTHCTSLNGPATVHISTQRG